MMTRASPAATSLLLALLALRGFAAPSAVARSAPWLLSSLGSHFSTGSNIRTFYQNGAEVESDLPECEPWSVCGRVDVYGVPWAERTCRCPATTASCSATSTDSNDNHTIVDKSRMYKICESVTELPVCRYFRDVTWTYFADPETGLTRQTVHCVCPPESVAYLLKHGTYLVPGSHQLGYRYLFACAPNRLLPCQRKEPCRLFAVNKRLDVEDVSYYTLCDCPHGHSCPRYHTEATVLQPGLHEGTAVRTYAAYCASPS